MNIIITEEQLKKFKKHLKEEKNSLDALNNFIDKNKVYERGSLKIYISQSLDRMVKRAFKDELNEYNVVLHLFE